MENYKEIIQRYCSRIDGNAVIAKLDNGEYKCLTPHRENCADTESECMILGKNKKEE